MRTLRRPALWAWHQHIGSLIAGTASAPLRTFPAGGTITSRFLAAAVGDDVLATAVGPFELRCTYTGVAWVPLLVIGHRRPCGRPHVVFGISASWEEGDVSPVIRTMLAVSGTNDRLHFRMLGAADVGGSALAFLTRLRYADERIHLGIA